MLILFPVFWAFPISEMVAELGSILPSEGGAYVWAREGLGEFWGWQVGFWGTFSTWLQQAMYVVLVAGYMEKFIPLSEAGSFGIKLLMILIFTVINLLGIREVSQVSTVLSVAVILGFCHGGGGRICQLALQSHGTIHAAGIRRDRQPRRIHLHRRLDVLRL
jgi:amino acid transporter